MTIETIEESGNSALARGRDVSWASIMSVALFDRDDVTDSDSDQLLRGQLLNYHQIFVTLDAFFGKRGTLVALIKNFLKNGWKVSGRARSRS